MITQFLLRKVLRIIYIIYNRLCQITEKLIAKGRNKLNLKQRWNP